MNKITLAILLSSVAMAMLGITILLHTFELADLKQEIRVLKADNVKYTEITRKLIEINTSILSREIK